MLNNSHKNSVNPPLRQNSKTSAAHKPTCILIKCYCGDLYFNTLFPAVLWPGSCSVCLAKLSPPSAPLLDSAGILARANAGGSSPNGVLFSTGFDCFICPFFKKLGSKAPSVTRLGEWRNSALNLACVFSFFATLFSVMVVALIDVNYLHSVLASVPNLVGPTPSLFSIVFFQSTGTLSIVCQMPGFFVLLYKRNEEFFFLPCIRGSLPLRLLRYFIFSSIAIVFVSVTIAWLSHLFYFWPIFSALLILNAKKVLVARIGNGLGFLAIVSLLYIINFVLLLASLPTLVGSIIFFSIFISSRVWYYASLAHSIRPSLGILSWAEFNKNSCATHSLFLKLFIYFIAKFKLFLFGPK